MILHGQAVAILKMSVIQPKLLRPVIHHFYKAFFRACNFLCQCYRSVIAGCHCDTLEQFINRHLLTRFKKNLRSTHRGGVFTRRHFVGQLQLTFINRLHCEQHGHDFRNARRR
ncbi:hypothetical protein D3C78_1558820 [compost metagenome]